MNKILWLIVLFLLCGCRHEFRLDQPSRFAQRITKNEAVVRYEPLEYSFRERKHRLMLHVRNPADIPVTLLADSSFVVDPWEQTNPVREQLIAPNAFIILELPPRISISSWTSHRFYSRTPPWEQVFSYSRSDTDTWPYQGIPMGGEEQLTTPYAWNWKTGTVRLHLGYKSGENRFAHEFVLRRDRPNAEHKNQDKPVAADSGRR